MGDAVIPLAEKLEGSLKGYLVKRTLVQTGNLRIRKVFFSK